MAPAEGSFKIGKGDLSPLPKGTKPEDVDITDPERAYKGSEEEFINGVATHEGTHFLKDIDLYQKSPKDFEENKENHPNEIEDKSRKEYNEKK